MQTPIFGKLLKAIFFKADSHSLFRRWFKQSQIFCNHINYAFSEVSFPMESNGVFKKIPTCYSPLVIFSNLKKKPIYKCNFCMGDEGVNGIADRKHKKFPPQGLGDPFYYFSLGARGSKWPCNGCRLASMFMRMANKATELKKSTRI